MIGNGHFDHISGIFRLIHTHAHRKDTIKKDHITMTREIFTYTVSSLDELTEIQKEGTQTKVSYEQWGPNRVYYWLDIPTAEKVADSLAQYNVIQELIFCFTMFQPGAIRTFCERLMMARNKAGINAPPFFMFGLNYKLSLDGLSADAADEVGKAATKMALPYLIIVTPELEDGNQETIDALVSGLAGNTTLMVIGLYDTDGNPYTAVKLHELTAKNRKNAGLDF